MPLLEIARQDEDDRLRTAALAASALLPLDETAAKHVAELVLKHGRAEGGPPDSLIKAAGNLPEVQALLDRWVQEDCSARRDAAERALADARILPMAVANGLMDGEGFPADLSGLGTLSEAGARDLLSSLVATLARTVDADDRTLESATDRLKMVVQALPGTAAAKLPVLKGPVRETRAAWLGALMTLVQPAAVLAVVYRQLDTDDASKRLDTLRRLVNAAPHISRPPADWPSPSSRPDERAGLVDLADLTVSPRRPKRGKRQEMGDGEGASATPDSRRAYARLDAPERVAPNEVLHLLVGLAPEPSPKVIQPTPFIVPSGKYHLSVQLIAPGFTVLGGSSLNLPMEVSPDDPFPYQLVRLRAEDHPDLAPDRVVTAVFSVDESMIGVAYRTVLVGEGSQRAAAEPDSPTAAGTTWVLPNDPETQPDLEIVIAPGNDALCQEVSWFYRSPHRSVVPPVIIPRRPLEGEGDWARVMMRGVQDHSTAVDLTLFLNGIGDIVSEAVPEEVWEALYTVADLSRPPTVLLATWDPYVPWELALVPRPWDSTIPKHLGAQAVVGRWTYRDRHRTAAPPARMRARGMAVVSGEYATNRLVEAEAEASQLCAHYKAEPVEALTEPVLNRLRQSPSPDILHFSVHGKFDVGGTQDGIKMTDGTFLSPLSVRGLRSEKKLDQVDLVFLNACQLAQGQRMLGSYAGMVASFLHIGVGAAIAPLWNVDDGVARTFAEGFYQAVLMDGTAPAEYVRQQRAGTRDASGAAASTPLAYLFFGHPRLTIDWEPQGADDA
ncbi:CHAT domain-containing protein [Streptomyces sp. NBC_01296]|uniref:CHAT domain-containing protein n=1 Tax=Streptomyces sp. NBC_01296 TaxID=2903816 RepID=UPI002E12C052|nr:CHAT domain-containing protein [Streptomyces sp. NBC_01296]